MSLSSRLERLEKTLGKCSACGAGPMHIVVVYSEADQGWCQICGGSCFQRPCPECGRGVAPVVIRVVYEEAENKTGLLQVTQ